MDRAEKTAAAEEAEASSNMARGVKRYDTPVWAFTGRSRPLKRPAARCNSPQSMLVLAAICLDRTAALQAAAGWLHLHSCICKASAREDVSCSAVLHAPHGAAARAAVHVVENRPRSQPRLSRQAGVRPPAGGGRSAPSPEKKSPSISPFFSNGSSPCA